MGEGREEGGTGGRRESEGGRDRPLQLTGSKQVLLLSNLYRCSWRLTQCH